MYPDRQKPTNEHLRAAEEFAMSIIDNFSAEEQNEVVNRLISILSINRDEKLKLLEASKLALIKANEELPKCNIKA